MANILFSPLGLTDPISNFHDGAMLHICRNYDIDKVYLYMSKEIYGYHKHDNRYLYCLDKLSEIKEKTIEHELIVKEELTDVHLFDFFIEEFRNIINELHEKYTEDTIYLNVSSGTPAMKSALQILSAFREFDFVAIQVTTPEKMSNPHKEEKRDYVPEDQWECNEDNTKCEKRCIISGAINFLNEIKKKQVAELIDSYEYSGALKLAESTDGFKNKEMVLKLLSAAVERVNLNYGKLYSYYRSVGIPTETDKYKSQLMEYMLIIWLKKTRREYCDFLRAVTPLLTEVIRLILKNNLKIDISEFETQNYKGDIVWDTMKLKNSSEFKNVFRNNEIANFNYIYDSQLIRIILNKATDKDIAECCEKLKKVAKIRNYAAHQLVDFTDEKIKKKTSLTSDEIITELKKAFAYGGYKIENSFFDSYISMNNIIKEYIS